MSRSKLMLVFSLLILVFSAVPEAQAQAANINTNGVNDAATGVQPPTALRYWSIYGTNLSEGTTPNGSAQTFFFSCGSFDAENENTQSGPGDFWYESPLQINFWAVSSCSGGSTNNPGTVRACKSGSQLCDDEPRTFHMP